MTENTLEIQYTGSITELDETTKSKLESRLNKLSNGHRDVIDATVGIQLESGDSQPREYRVRVTVHQPSDTLIAETRSGQLSTAVNDVLRTVERQVREKRNKRRDSRRRTV